MVRTTKHGPTSDFSPIASRYDLTRDIPQPCLRACYERLVQQRLLPERGVIVDAGCGTGQISLALAEMDYEVCGFDVSPDMLLVARAKRRPKWRVHYVAADVRSLPVQDNRFEAVVVSKLFQHVHDWQRACHELLRVLRPGCCIFHLNERGAFGNAVRKYFAGRADAMGFTERYLGLRDRRQLSQFLVAQGCETPTLDVADLKWTKRITYGEALSHLQDRLHAEFWYLPPEVYEHILADTARWIAQQPGGPETVEHLAPYLVADVFRRSTAA